MALQVNCPSCQQTFALTSPLKGEDTDCPLCGRRFNVNLEGHFVLQPPPMRPASEPVHGIRFTFSCARCSSVLEARDSLCGRPGRCPTCGGVFRIPPIDPQTGLAVGRAMIEDDGQLPTPMHAYATAGARAPKIHTRPDGHQVILCPRCQREMPIDAHLCRSCGMPFTMEGAETVIQSSGPEANTMASAALTVGVLSIPTFCVPILGLVAIGLGLAAMRKSRILGTDTPGRKMAIAGIACGIVSIALCAASYLL